MNNQTPVINILEKAVRKAGKVLIRDFGEIENLQIQTKNIGDFVTNADIKSEKIIIETLKYYYPNSFFISEETNNTINIQEETFIIDPIDGTTNFIHGIPMFGIVIARLFKNEITDGVIYNPITNDFFWSSKGQGAWCNNKRLRVSKRENLTECIIGTGIPFGGNKIDDTIDKLLLLSNKCSGIRQIGAAAINLAYVAAGKLDAYSEKNLSIWDICAGVLLVKEAGGKVTLTDGEVWDINSKEILASNNKIHEYIIS